MGSVEDRLDALAVKGLGPALYRRLVRQFGSWQAVTGASVRSLAGVPGVSSQTAEAIRSPVREFDPSAELEDAKRQGVSIVADDDPGYPPGLNPMDDAPPALYVRGALLPTDALAVAIVGTRRCSVYGQTQAERLGAALASAGITVVSGLARGIDAAGHRGALRGKGRTIAVMGCGLGRIYPPEHEELADRIAEQGAVLSELPMSTPPRSQNFPARNRLIAGLSLGVVVVEAGERSGALITSRLANELGRQVFAVPGEISRPQSRGCHALIRDGARIVTDVRDILDEIESLRELVPDVETAQELPLPNLNDVERTVYGTLDDSPKDIDLIVREAEIPAGNAASALMALELRGLVRQLPGKRFLKAQRARG